MQPIRQFNIILLMSFLLMSAAATAQVSETLRWLRVGDLHSWYSGKGAEIEIGRTGSANEQLDGLRWEAQFRNQDTEVAKAMWIGTTNYDDPINGNFYPHKVVAVGPRSADPVGTVMPYEFKMIGKSFSPTVIVDGDPATENRLNDIVDETDPDMKADRMIINKMHTSMGVSVTRKIMAFSQQNHDNYFVYEYVFKNTGIIDLEGTTVTKTLTDVIFFFQYRYSFGLEAFRCGGCNWAPNNSITWGYNTVNQVIGQDPNAADFEMRAQYSWYGRHSQSPYASLGAPWRTGDGRFAAPQFTGTVTLHADRSATDKSDDPAQPITTYHIGSDRGPQANNQFDASLMTRKYDAMARGHSIPTHADQVGDGFADRFASNEFGGYAQGQGFGPYTLAPGDSIRIVIAEGVKGLRRQQGRNISSQWLAGLEGQQSTFTMPDGSETDDPNLFKDSWVMTGEDSLKDTFRRAIENFNSDYDFPEPPPAPRVFEVNSGGDQIILNWADNAVSHPNFDGYRVYRAIARPDTVYEQIFECDLSNLTHEYRDRSAQRGFEYYYYVVSKDDGSTNDVQPGLPLTSSKFYTMTNKPAFLRKPAGQSLSEIRVVPNPYDIRSRRLQFGTEPSARDRLAFFGLPPECTIKIYTERGDLVDTIEHNDGSGDELWNSLTSSEQLIASGIYIAYFRVNRDVFDENSGEQLYRKGESTTRKFIVIR